MKGLTIPEVLWWILAGVLVVGIVWFFVAVRG